MQLNKKSYLRILNRFTNVHIPGKEQNILIFSTPRSGSTWLNEIISSQKGIKYCNEPLNIRIKQIRNLSGIQSWMELYDDEVMQKLEPYFRSICRGKMKWFNPNPLSSRHNFITNRISFKIINGCENHFNHLSLICNGRIVYLLRHPIPVSLSRKDLPRFDVLTSRNIYNSFPPKIQDEIRSVKKKGDSLEMAVLSWCIQTKLALRQKKDDWIIISYEQLVVDPNPIIDLLCSELSLKERHRSITQLRKPSKVTIQSSHERKEMVNEENRESNRIIDGWRKRISEPRERELFNIIESFELDDIYSFGTSYPKNDYWIK